MTIPKIIFDVGWLLDDSVADLTKTEINSEASTELFERLSEFQNAWAEQGPKLLQPVLTSFPLKFKEKDIKVYLLCGALTSQSHPLLVNVKYYLQSFKENPRPLSEFVEHLFHELLHILLEDNLKIWPTPLIKKFENESQDVKTHLHLMFLHKFSHDSLNLGNQSIKEWYEEIDPVYGHTWSLAESESEALADELRSCFG